MGMNRPRRERLLEGMETRSDDDREWEWDKDEGNDDNDNNSCITTPSPDGSFSFLSSPFSVSINIVAMPPCIV